MSRKVTYDGTEALEVRFSFDRRLVERIKSLPHRRWNAADRFWSVPREGVVELVDLLHPDEFAFDEATCDLYRQFGGALAIRPTAEPARRSRLPGLFDGPDAEESENASGASKDFTVSVLNERARQAIESAFPAAVWLVGEISGFNKSSHRRHVNFELVERAEKGASVSRVPATLFESTRRELETELRRAGDPFRMEDEISVRLKVRVGLYVPWGQYRIVVEKIDVNYTLGEAARRREEIVRRLGEAGLLEVNSALPLPRLPLRVAVVTSLGSDACNDVVRTFQESALAFRLTIHGARVQGNATEPSVLNALDWIRERRERFDAVLICRGGGSRTDLIWFDSETLGRAVAGFPLPVVIGIGHEQDQSVLDAVARSCKTPTAAATLLVQRAALGLDTLETLRRQILDAAAGTLRRERDTGTERAARLARSTRSMLELESTRLAHVRQRAALGIRSLLQAGRERTAGLATRIPLGAGHRIDRAREVVQNVLRSLSGAARKEMAFEATRTTGLARSLASSCRAVLRREEERWIDRDRRVRLAHPRNILDRGYAILRSPSGDVLTSASGAPTGTAVRAELRDGCLQLRSEGRPEPRSRE